MLKLHNWLSTWIFVCVCPDGEWFLNKVWWDLGALKCCCHSYFTNSASGTQGLVKSGSIVTLSWLDCLALFCCKDSFMTVVHTN